jgi:tetratricopeptide (TPR) repeat protein
MALKAILFLYIYYMRILLILFLLCCTFCFSQEISPEFTRIKEDSLLTVNEKDVEFQGLLEKHKLQNKPELLLGDSYQITRWYWTQGWNWADKAIALSKKNLDAIDSLNIIDDNFRRLNLYSLGYYQFYNYNLEDALIPFKKLLTYKERDEYALQSAYKIAEIYFAIGYYYSSKDYYYLSKTIAEQKKNTEYVIKNAIGVAQASKLINSTASLREGIDLLDTTLQYVHSIKNNPSSTIIINDIDFHSLYNQLGNLYTDREDHAFLNGKINLEKALEIAKTLNNPNLLLRTYNDLGLLYLKEEKEEAKLYFEKALTFESDDYIRSQVYRNLSAHSLLLKKHSKALSNIQSSISILVNLDTSNLKNLPSKSDLNKSNAKILLISCLIDKANIWIKLSEENLKKKKNT